MPKLDRLRIRPTHPPVLTRPQIRIAKPLEVKQWAKQGLEKLGMDTKAAEVIAAGLIQTSLWGIDSHGIARLGHYFRRIEIGSIRARPRIIVKRTGRSTAQIDGGHGHGIYVCTRAIDEAVRLARRSGVGVVGISNSSHCGAIGLYGRRAAAEGMISIGFTHSDAFVAPHGGRRKFLGTNPICITIPTKDAARPLCMDMATSAVPFNRVVNYRRENKFLQPGWALDAKGFPTVVAEAAACLMPLAGHKGYGLALMIDLLCGPLNGMPFGPHIPDMYHNLSLHRKLGSFFVVVDPMRFAGGRRLRAAASRMAEEARRQPKVLGAKEILAPGDPEYRSEVKRRKGIPVEPGLWVEILEWSRRLGIEPPKFRNQLR